MNSNNLKIISTFSEYMICPYTLLDEDIDHRDLSEIGYDDFVNYKYRHNSESYKGTSLVDTNFLLEKLIFSIKNSCNLSQKEPLLLLSDGKDSMGIALALSRMGIQCRTLTFLRNSDDALKKFIKSVAQKLNHKPYFMTVEEIQSNFVKEEFIDSCKYMDNPVLDQGFLFFLLGSKLFFKNNNLDPSRFVIIDGLGNDEHFGYIPSNSQLISFKFSKLGLWKLLPSSLPFFRWFIRSPSESHGDLSALAAFFPFGSSFDLNKYFSLIPKSLEPTEFVDFRAFSRGSFHDHQCMMEKTIVTAKYLGSQVAFPWADKAIAEYCFNLPLQEKFNFKSSTNKILLRKLLKEKIGWNQEKRGVDLYVDMEISYLKDKLSKIATSEIIDKICKSKASKEIKQRALLELLNFYGYCLSHDIHKDTVKKILMGRL